MRLATEYIFTSPSIFTSSYLHEYHVLGVIVIQKSQVFEVWIKVLEICVATIKVLSESLLHLGNYQAATSGLKNEAKDCQSATGCSFLNGHLRVAPIAIQSP